MTTRQAWVGLSTEDVRDMLISLAGFRFGTEPETRHDEIREERKEMECLHPIVAIGQW